MYKEAVQRTRYRIWNFVQKKGCFFSVRPRRCLECRNHAKNLINGKISFFYIEAISQKNSQLRKKTFPKIIFFGTKNFPENVLRKIDLKNEFFYFSKKVRKIFKILSFFFRSQILKMDFRHEKLIFFIQFFFSYKVWTVTIDSARLHCYTMPMPGWFQRKPPKPPDFGVTGIFSRTASYVTLPPPALARTWEGGSWHNYKYLQWVMSKVGTTSIPSKTYPWHFKDTLPLAL